MNSSDGMEPELNEYKVTWLLPIKNGMPFLPETLQSIENQTYKNWEVLAWDNGSTDGTIEELEKWIPSRLPGRIITGRPLRLSLSLHEMVKECETKICARIDADDINAPERLERQISFLKKHPEIAVLGTQMNRIDENGKNFGRLYSLYTKHDDIVHCMLHLNGISHPTTVFRRDAILEAGNYQDVGEINVEDYDLWLRVAARHQVANLSEPLVNYRVHAKSTTQMAMANNRLDQAMHACFCEHAPALYGCTPKEAQLLCARKYPQARRVLRKIAAHLQKTQTVSGRANEYPTIKDRIGSPSFVFAARHLLSPRDYKTKIWLRWMEKGMSALPLTFYHLTKRLCKRISSAKP